MLMVGYLALGQQEAGAMPMADEVGSLASGRKYGLVGNLTAKEQPID